MTLIVAVLACVGVWGCAQGQAKKSASTEERVRALETRCAKLEQDYKAVSLARDQAHKRIAALETEKTELQAEVEKGRLAALERDDLKVLVSSRTAERDAYQTQFEELRKGIRTLLGRADTAVPITPSLTGSAVTLSAPRILAP
jgi:outer membrane murein-binding lipoprotein Lpp